MPLAPRPTPRDLAGTRAVFTDLDGTLTTEGLLRPSTYAAIGTLGERGVPVIIVTGRPASWGDALARAWPVAAVVTENGGVAHVRNRHGIVSKRLAIPPARLAVQRARMEKAIATAIQKIPGARLSADSRYREVDLAIDWNEDVRLPESSAKDLERALRLAGFNAVRSSVHVNVWPGRFDKLSACKWVMKHVLGRDATRLSPYVYVGDALNDEPLFRAFPRAVGVANVARVWAELRHRPRFVTRAAEGRGFEEVARAILSRPRPGV